MGVSVLVRSALPLLLTLGVAACSVYASPACHVGADCASGVCDADGTCGVATSSSGGGGTGGHTSTGSSAGGSGTCSPNHDGIITRAEVPIEPGLHANFLAAEDAGVSSAGNANANGTFTWDLAVTLSGDHPEAVDTLALGTVWFGADFPGASYAARLSDSADLLGVFTLSEAALTLVGVASPTAGSGQTELKYAPGVTVLSFPMKAGATWSTTATVTGEAEGVSVEYTEAYQSTIDATGSLKTPYATFDVLRVNTLLTRDIDFIVTTTRTFSFVTECFGNVANIVSGSDPLTAEITTAAEVTRLSP